MATYDYRCTDCATVFEVSRPMGQPGEEHCPSCGAIAEKIFSPVGIAFKGTGFHNTDYRPKVKDEASTCPSAGDSPACSSCPAAAGD
jgi:putative FmdB family regulatory protein